MAGVDQDNLRIKFLGLNVEKVAIFSAIGLSNVKMVADRHRHYAAYHNKH